MQNNVNSNILIWGTYYHKFGQNITIFKIVCTKYMASSEVMTSSTHSFAYSYRLVKICFLKICETSKCHNFLIFQPIFMQVFTVILNLFTLSSKLKLNLLWSSSLMIYWVYRYMVNLIKRSRKIFHNACARPWSSKRSNYWIIQLRVHDLYIYIQMPLKWWSF